MRIDRLCPLGPDLAGCACFQVTQSAPSSDWGRPKNVTSFECWSIRWYGLYSVSLSLLW